MPDGPLFFFDSSAVIKYYQEESGSPLVVDIVDKNPTQCYICALSSAEVPKGIRKNKYRLMNDYGKEWHKEIVRGYEETITEWLADLKDEYWKVVFGDAATLKCAGELFP